MWAYFSTSVSLMCSCVLFHVWKMLLWSNFLAVILHDVWGMSNIQAGTIAEQKQWGKNNDPNLSLKARCLQSKSHLIKTVLLALAYQVHLLYSSMCVSTRIVISVSQCSALCIQYVCIHGKEWGSRDYCVGLCVWPVCLWVHMLISVAYTMCICGVCIST